MRLGDALAVLAVLLLQFVRHMEYFPEWAQQLIAIGWSVAMLYMNGGA